MLFRSMKLQLRLKSGLTAVLVSAYAPTMTATEDEKEAFYESLNAVIESVPYKHKLFILGDFNARVGRDYSTWPRVLAIIPSAMRTLTDPCCYKHVIRMS